MKIFSYVFFKLEYNKYKNLIILYKNNLLYENNYYFY